jgi:hypothetical protein
MKQWKKFINPVYKTDYTNRELEVGDSVVFVLHDGSYQTETVTEVSDGGRKVAWEHDVNSTRKEDVRAVASAHQFSCLYYGGATIFGGEEISL